MLSAKTAVMDPDRLDGVEGRLGALQTKLGAAASDNKNSVDGERLARLEEMIAVAERCQPMYDAIPETVARLESLQAMHLQVK